MSTLPTCDDVYARRPGWASAFISGRDARYLFERAVAAGTPTIVEIGTASGTSSAILCHALETAHSAGSIGPDYRLISYDLRSRFHHDRSKPAGAAVQDMLEPSQLEHIEFRNPETSLTLHRHHAADEIEFMFVDANHHHPWPCIDLLATLDLLRPGAEVAFHDINLPVIHPQFQDWGAKHLFDDLDVEKHADEASDPPNIGSIIIPEDKEGLRQQLIAIATSHEWAVSLPEEISAPLLGALDAVADA